MRPTRENSYASLIQSYIISKLQSIPFVFLYHFRLVHPRLDSAVTEISYNSTAWLCTYADLGALIP